VKGRTIEKKVVKNGSISELGSLGHRLSNSIPDRLVSLRLLGAVIIAILVMVIMGIITFR